MALAKGVTLHDADARQSFKNSCRNLLSGVRLCNYTGLRHAKSTQKGESQNRFAEWGSSDRILQRRSNRKIESGFRATKSSQSGIVESGGRSAARAARKRTTSIAFGD